MILARGRWWPNGVTPPTFRGWSSPPVEQVRCIAHDPALRHVVRHGGWWMLLSLHPRSSLRVPRPLGVCCSFLPYCVSTARGPYTGFPPDHVRSCSEALANHRPPPRVARLRARVTVHSTSLWNRRSRHGIRALLAKTKKLHVVLWIDQIKSG